MDFGIHYESYANILRVTGLLILSSWSKWDWHKML